LNIPMYKKLGSMLSLIEAIKTNFVTSIIYKKYPQLFFVQPLVVIKASKQCHHEYYVIASN